MLLYVRLVLFIVPFKNTVKNNLPREAFTSYLYHTVSPIQSQFNSKVFLCKDGKNGVNVAFMF